MTRFLSEGERVSSVRGGTRKWILIKMHQSAFSAIAAIERKRERKRGDGKWMERDRCRIGALRWEEGKGG